jgi:hypothetical protein
MKYDCRKMIHTNVCDPVALHIPQDKTCSDINLAKPSNSSLALIHPIHFRQGFGRPRRHLSHQKVGEKNYGRDSGREYQAWASDEMISKLAVATCLSGLIGLFSCLPPLPELFKNYDAISTHKYAATIYCQCTINLTRFTSAELDEAASCRDIVICTVLCARVWRAARAMQS